MDSKLQVSQDSTDDLQPNTKPKYVSSFQSANKDRSMPLFGVASPWQLNSKRMPTIAWITNLDMGHFVVWHPLSCVILSVFPFARLP